MPFEPGAAGFASGHSLDFLDARIITHATARAEGAGARARSGRIDRRSRIVARGPRGNRPRSEKPRADQGSRERQRPPRTRGDPCGDLQADRSATGSTHRKDSRPIPAEPRKREVNSLLANPGLGPAKERYTDEAANFEFASLIEQRYTAFVHFPLVGVQYPAGRIRVPGSPHAAEDDHPDNRLILQIALTQVAQGIGIRRGRRKYGDDRADVLAVDLLDADQSARLPRAVADGLPQPCRGRCLAPGRTAPDQNENKEVPQQFRHHRPRRLLVAYLEDFVFPHPARRLHLDLVPGRPADQRPRNGRADRDLAFSDVGLGRGQRNRIHGRIKKKPPRRPRSAKLRYRLFKTEGFAEGDLM